GQLVIPPACERGTVSMTFRKPSLQRFTLDDYVSSGRFGKANRTVNRQKELFDWQKEMKRLIAAREFIEFFRLAVQHKLNIIISVALAQVKRPLLKLWWMFTPEIKDY
ncbi:hypothetical protein MJN17_23420, partial [Salmonella enterica subsp. enterica serovar Kentucky]|nr:hypothetical protein [Salmonella enterica subsp. enterica serovar Kentucky]